MTVAADIFGSSACAQPGGSWADDGYNVASDGSCFSNPSPATDIQGGASVENLLGPPADNGGPTETMALLAGNPAIGDIPIGAVMGPVPNITGALTLCAVAADQRGIPSAEGRACDSGAVQLAGQTISVTSRVPADALVAGPTYQVSATASSGLPVSISVASSSSSVCSLSGSTVNFIGAGTCTVDFNQAGDGNWLPATEASQSFQVGERASITSPSAATFTIGQIGLFTVTTTGAPTPALTESGALPGGVRFTDNGNGTATLAGTPWAGRAGSYPVTITASNGVSPEATQRFTLTVDAPAAITERGGRDLRRRHPRHIQGDDHRVAGTGAL